MFNKCMQKCHLMLLKRDLENLYNPLHCFTKSLWQFCKSSKEIHTPHDLSLLNVTFQLPHLFQSLMQISTAFMMLLSTLPSPIQSILCFAWSWFHFWTPFTEHLFSQTKICPVCYIYSTWHIIYLGHHSVHLFLFSVFLNKVSVTVHKRMAGDFHFFQSFGIVCLILATKWFKPVINIYI